MGMSKATAVRKIARDFDISRSNREIAAEVRRRFGLDVGSNQIVELLGPHRQRKYGGKAFSLGLQMAAEYLKKIGNASEAVRYLHLAKGAQND